MTAGWPWSLWTRNRAGSCSASFSATGAAKRTRQDISDRTRTFCGLAARLSLFLQESLNLQAVIQGWRSPAGEPFGDELPRYAEHSGNLCTAAVFCIGPGLELGDESL